MHGQNPFGFVHMGIYATAGCKAHMYHVRNNNKQIILQ